MSNMRTDTFSEPAAACFWTSDSTSHPCPLCGAERSTRLLAAPDRFHCRQCLYTLSQCGNCACVWLQDPPQPEEMGFHYGEDYHRAITAGGERSAVQRWQYSRRQILKHKKRGALLDIGCSSGAFLTTMKQEGWQLYGIEMETSTAEKARSSSGAEIFVGDALDAPFRAASFDVITSFDLLEHIYDPKRLLAKVFEWLKPGGLYYAVLPNIQSWEARFFGTYWYGLELPRHLFHYSPTSVRYIMSSLGFEELFIHTPPCSYAEHSVGYIYRGLLCRLGIKVPPLSKQGRQTLLWRALRKSLRITLVDLWAYVCSTCGSGPSLEIAFRKPLQ